MVGKVEGNAANSGRVEVLVVDAINRPCLMCRKQRNNNNNNNDVSDCENKWEGLTLPLKMLARHLEININEVARKSATSSVVTHPPPLIENRKVGVALCEGCSSRMDRFGKLYNQLQVIKMQVDGVIGEIEERITASMNEDEDVDDDGGGESFEAHFAKNLRNDIKDKCLVSSVMTYPRVKLVGVTEKVADVATEQEAVRVGNECEGTMQVDASRTTTAKGTEPILPCPGLVLSGVALRTAQKAGFYLASSTVLPSSSVASRTALEAAFSSTEHVGSGSGDASPPAAVASPSAGFMHPPSQGEDDLIPFGKYVMVSDLEEAAYVEFNQAMGYSPQFVKRFKSAPLTIDLQKNGSKYIVKWRLIGWGEDQVAEFESGKEFTMVLMDGRKFQTTIKVEKSKLTMEQSCGDLVVKNVCEFEGGEWEYPKMMATRTVGDKTVVCHFKKLMIWVPSTMTL